MIKKHKSKTRLDIPKQKDGSKNSLKIFSKQQEAVVIAAIDTIVKFLKNNKKYKPLQATVMGCGGTGKSFIINTIISIVRNMTQMNVPLKWEYHQELLHTMYKGQHYAAYLE